MALNIGLARKVVEFAELHQPDFHHNQCIILERRWHGTCQTVGCLAGITTMLASEDVVDLGRNASGRRTFSLNGEEMLWDQCAQRLLGLTDEQARLFGDYGERHAISRLKSYIAEAEARL